MTVLAIDACTDPSSGSAEPNSTVCCCYMHAQSQGLLRPLLHVRPGNAVGQLLDAIKLVSFDIKLFTNLTREPNLVHVLIIGIIFEFI